ncbi:MAG: hypothetical protein J7521_02545 [Caulobacter sp.]|nr:hypothetical protein [Caulobacter sp.]
MQHQPWFRARHPERKHGFRVIHWKGVAITMAFVVVVASLLVGPYVVFGRQPALMIGGGLLTLVVVAAFMAVVRSRTENWRD